MLFIFASGLTCFTSSSVWTSLECMVFTSKNRKHSPSSILWRRSPVNIYKFHRKASVMKSVLVKMWAQISVTALKRRPIPGFPEYRFWEYTFVCFISLKFTHVFEYSTKQVFWKMYRETPVLEFLFENVSISIRSSQCFLRPFSLRTNQVI